MTTSDARPRRAAGAPAALDDPLTEALVQDPPVLHPGGGVRGPAHVAQERRAAGRRLLPRPVEPRQGRALHPRRELHRLVLVEGVRQGRHHHLGVAADRLPVGRAGQPRVRAPRLPSRRRLLLVHLLPHPGPLPLRPRRAAGDVPRGQGAASATRCSPGPTSCPTPSGRRRYKSARGKGGLVRASWEEAIEIVAAAHVYTIKRFGPDRVAGFSPIPAMSMVSHASGARFVSLIGGSMLSFYDWYADLPVASPQVFGDQTDVPESGDWWDAGYLIMWGSNVPVTRTPDAHWMAEARYRGQKVVAVSPDYADNVKFADEWLAVAPGTDGALAMAMGHVTLKEFFVDRQVPYFTDYVKKYTDLPFLVRLEERDGNYFAGQVPDRSPTCPASRTPAEQRRVQDGAAGLRTGEAGRAQRLARLPVRRRRARGEWNLDLGRGRPAAVSGRRATAGCGRSCSCPASTRPTARPPALLAWRAGAAGRRPPGHHRLRPDARAVRRRAATGCPELADRVRRPGAAVHAGLAGDDHRRPGREGRAHRPGVRRERRGVHAAGR